MAELDLLVLTLGVLYESCYAVVTKQIELFADWDIQLANSAMHAAIYTRGLCQHSLRLVLWLWQDIFF